MAAMDLNIDGAVEGRVLNYKRQYTAQKIISTALDGSSYAQNTGNAITRYVVYVYCSTAAHRNALDSASNTCDIVSIIDRNGSEIRGYIEDEGIEWKEWVDGSGVGKFVLIKE